MPIVNIWQIFQNRFLDKGIIGLLFRLQVKEHHIKDISPYKNPSKIMIRTAISSRVIMKTVPGEVNIVEVRKNKY